MKNASEIKGKVIVVTGASSGFGRGAALELAKRGARLSLAARRGEVIEELAAECRRLGSEALAIETDVSDPLAVRELCKRTLEQFGRIDVWVNDAGVGALGRFDEMPLEVHEQVIRTNLLGTIHGSWHALQQFRKQQSGTLINVASEVGEVPVPYYAVYSASKHGVIGLSNALRQELLAGGEEGRIHVCTVLPDAHDTHFFTHQANFTGHETTAPTPLHDPRNVVEVIVRLVTEPKAEVKVGSESMMMTALHAVAPRTVEKMGAKKFDKQMIQETPVGPTTHGAVERPMQEGTGVRGGWTEKNKAKQKQKKAEKNE